MLNVDCWATGAEGDHMLQVKSDRCLLWTGAEGDHMLQVKSDRCLLWTGAEGAAAAGPEDGRPH